MSTSYILDSRQTPALDGHVLPGGTYVPDSQTLILQKTGASSGSLWLIFRDVIFTKYHRCSFAQLRLQVATSADPLLLNVRAVKAASISPPSGAEEIAQWPLTEAQTVSSGLLTSGQEVALSIRHIINDLLEAIPPDSQPRDLGLLIEFAPNAAIGTADFVSGQAQASQPVLELQEESVLNIWRGDAPEQPTIFRVRVMEPVIVGTEYTISLEHTRSIVVRYVAAPGDTPITVAANLASVLESAEPGTVEYADGSDSFTYTSPMLGAETRYEVTSTTSKVDLIRAGALAVTQIVDVSLESTVIGGTWKMTATWGAGPETTADIPWNASAAEIKAALEGLTTPQPGDVLVYQTGAFSWRIEFAGTLSGQQATVSIDHTGLIFNRVRLSRIQEADPDGDFTNLYTMVLVPQLHDPIHGVIAPTEIEQDGTWRIRFGDGPWSEIAQGPYDRWPEDGHLEATLPVSRTTVRWDQALRHQIGQLLPPEDAAKITVVADRYLTVFGDLYSGTTYNVPALLLVSIPQSIIAAHGAFTVQYLLPNGGGEYWPISPAPIIQTPAPLWFFTTLTFPGRNPPNGMFRIGNQTSDQIRWIYKLSGTRTPPNGDPINWSAGSWTPPVPQYVYTGIPFYFINDEDQLQWAMPSFGDTTRDVADHLAINSAGGSLFSIGAVSSLGGHSNGQHGNLIDTDPPPPNQNGDTVYQLLGGSARWLLAWDGPQTPTNEDIAIDDVWVIPDSAAGRISPQQNGFRAKAYRLGSPTAPRNQIDRLQVLATGGTFTLTANGDTTAPVDIPTNPEAIDVAVAAAAGSDVLSVRSLSSAEHELEWSGAYAGQAVNVSADGSAATGPGGQLEYVRQARPAVNEIQRITLDPTAFDGTFRFSSPLNAGLFSPPVAWNADVADLQQAADQLLGAAASIWSGNDLGGPWTVEFTGPIYGGRPLPLMQLRQSLRVTGSSLEITELARGSGPNHWAIATNWSLGRVPQTGDLVVLADGSTDILYGLTQRAGFAVQPGSPVCRLLEVGDFTQGQIVRVSSSGMLPSPLVAGRDYVITEWSALHREFQLADARTGQQVIFADAGIGDHEIGIYLQQIHARMAYRGGLGLPIRTSTGGLETRQRYLRIGFLKTYQRQALLGLGVGPGFKRFFLDVGTGSLSLEAFQSGPAVGDQASIQLLCRSGDLEIVNHGASIGLAQNPGELSRFRKLALYGGSTRLGRQVAALPGATIVRHGGAELLCEDCELAGAILSLLE